MRFQSAFAAFALLAAPAVAGQPEPVGGEDEVLIVGRETREKQARDFVRDITRNPGNVEPIARFDWAPLCPVAVGLSDAQNEAVTTRMRRVAASANIDLAAPGCRANALLIVAPDKAEMVAALRKAHPAYFLSSDTRMIQPDMRGGPAVAWHLKGRVDRSGSPVDSSPGATVSTSITPSRISASFRPVFLGSVVIVERDAVIGLSTTQLADYAAMRTFGAVDPAKLRKSGTSSIATILDAPSSAQVPLTLTRWDMAYLRALYAGTKDHYGPRQRLQMARAISDELAKAADNPTN